MVGRMANLAAGLAAGIALAGLSLAALPAAAQAQGEPMVPPGTEAAAPSGDPALDDMACFLIMGAVADRAPEEIRNDGNMILMYFVGKLYGREPAFDMRAALARYNPVIDAMDQPPQIVRCLAEFGGMAASLQAAGES